MAGHERDTARQRPIEECARAHAGRQPAPQVQPALRPREPQRTRGHVLLDRRHDHPAATRVLGAQRLQVRVEAPVADQPRHRELHEVLRVRVDPLLDDRHLVDDRRRRGQPSEAETRREHLREAVQVNHDVVRVELPQRRRRLVREVQFAVGRVLHDRHPVALGQLQQLPPRPDRQRHARRVVERRVRVNELGTVADEQILELVDLAAQDVPPDQLGAGGAERLDGAEIAGPIEDDRVSGVDETPREEIEPLLRSGEDQHALGRDAETVGDRLAQIGLSFGRPVTPCGVGVAAQHVIDRLLELRRRETVDGRLPRREREEPRIERIADRVAKRGIVGPKCRGRDLSAPRKRRPRRLGRRAHEGAPADIPAQEPLGFELAIRAHHRRPADR